MNPRFSLFYTRISKSSMTMSRRHFPSSLGCRCFFLMAVGALPPSLLEEGSNGHRANLSAIMIMVVVRSYWYWRGWQQEKVAIGVIFAVVVIVIAADAALCLTPVAVAVVVIVIVSNDGGRCRWL